MLLARIMVEGLHPSEALNAKGSGTNKSQELSK
jgi:hypothetical protein